MKTRIFSFFFMLCLCISLPVFAQEKTPKVSANAGVEPFVSRLKAAVRGPHIKLSWRDSPDSSAEYMVYRHTQEITAENFKDAEFVARLARGLEMHIDSPPMAGEHFYAVLAVTPDGTIHSVFIPFRNKTTLGIAAEELLPDNSPAAVSGLAARAERDKIVISFAASRGDRVLMLFRSTSPILLPTELLATREAHRVKSSETEFIDFPVSGIPYYYALVDENELNEGDVKLTAGSNTTKEYAEIPLKEDGSALAPLISETSVLPGMTQPDSGRPLPLPYYILDSKVSAEEALKESVSLFIPAYRRLSAKAEKAAADIIAKTTPREKEAVEPVLLEADRAPALSREDYTLNTVLKGCFAEKDWKETEKLLTHFMNMHITDGARHKAHFYKGQALFFQEKYRESFLEFLLARDAYYTETQIWLDRITGNLKT